MPNRLTRGKALVGDLYPTSGKFVHAQTGTVARTDTSAKTLFTLPANAVILSVALYSGTASDAGTTATVAVGKTGGTGTDYLAATSVKATGVLGSTAGVLGTVGTSQVSVTGTYAETGTASTTGGPFTVIVQYTT